MKLSINNYHKEEYEKRSTYMKLNHLVEGRNLNKLQLLYIVIFTIFLLPACSQDLSRSEAEDLLKNKTEETMLYGWLHLSSKYIPDRKDSWNPSITSPNCTQLNFSCLERNKAVWSRMDLNSEKEAIEKWESEGWVSLEKNGSAIFYGVAGYPQGVRYPQFRVSRTEKLKQHITKYDTIAIAKITFDKVTGVTMLDNNTAKVTYITKLEPTEAGKFMIKGIDQNKSIPEESVHLRRYDDGWRIEKEK